MKNWAKVQELEIAEKIIFDEKTRVRPVARNGSIYQISVDRRSLVRHSDVRPSEKVGSYLIERQHERLFVVEKPDSSVFRSNPIHRRELSGP